MVNKKTNQKNKNELPLPSWLLYLNLAIQALGLIGYVLFVMNWESVYKFVSILVFFISYVILFKSTLDSIKGKITNTATLVAVGFFNIVGLVLSIIMFLMLASFFSLGNY